MKLKNRHVSCSYFNFAIPALYCLPGDTLHFTVSVCWGGGGIRGGGNNPSESGS